MNKNLISKALSGIDDRFIAEAFVYEKKRMSSPERTLKMGRYENTTSKGHSRRLVILIAAACLVFSLAITAYAADVFGIRDMFRSERQELPEKADAYIQQHTEAAKEEDLQCRIDESLCDGGKIMVTLTVTGGDNYILASAIDDYPYTPVSESELGITGDGTLESYAKAQGKELLFIGASLMQNEDLGIFTETYRVKHPTPNEMHILVESTRMGTSAIAGDAVCSVYIQDVEGNQKTMDVPFTLTQATNLDSEVFTPENPNVIPGITYGEATITRAPTGMSIRWKVEMEDENVIWDQMTTIEGITSYEGGYVHENDGWYYELYKVEGEIGDTLTARVVNWSTDEPIADVVFHRK